MINGKKVLAVVPARGGSKGVRLKNIRPINGVPLVSLVGRVVSQIDLIDRCVVSTDHPRIAEIAKESGLAVPFMRPDDLSGDIVGDWDVLNHALKTTEKLDDTEYDIIVMLQPTCPLRRKEHVVQAINALVRGNYDAVWTVSETDSKHHPMKQLTKKNDLIDYYDPKGATIIARQQLTKLYHRNGAAYAITRDCLVNKKSIKGDITGVVEIDDPLVSIDTEMDFLLCEFLIGRESGMRMAK